MSDNVIAATPETFAKSFPVTLLPPVMPDTTPDADANLNYLRGDRQEQNEMEYAGLEEILKSDEEHPSWSGAQAPTEFDVNEFEYPPDITIQHDLVVPDTRTIFDDGHLETQYVNPSPLKTTVGVAALTTTAIDVLGTLATVAVPNTRLIFQGSGVLLGLSLASAGFGASVAVMVTDSLDGNGPVLAILNALVVQNGYLNFGVHGLRVTQGVTLVGLAGTKLAVIPFIKAVMPVNP